MYNHDAKKFSIIYRRQDVSKITGKLGTGMPLTVFAPSGFGKSIVVRYMTYHNHYKLLHPIRTFNTHFVYFDCKVITTENVNVKNVMFSSSESKNMTGIYKEMIYPDFLQALKNSLADDGLNFPKTDKLIDFLDELIKRYSKKRFFVFLDSFDLLISEKYFKVRQILKYLRDRYRGHIEYIFVLSEEKYLYKENLQDLGEILNMLGERIISLPIKSSLVSYGLSSSILPSYIYYIYYLINWKIRNRFRLINQLAGGYGPYIKHLMVYSESELKKIIRDKSYLNFEIESRSERLLRSLTPTTNRLLIQIAKTGELNTEDKERAYRLRNLGMVLDNDRLFSPLMERFLTRY